MALAFVAGARLLKPHILAQQTAKALLESLSEELCSQNRYSGWPFNCFEEKLQELPVLWEWELWKSRIFWSLLTFFHWNEKDMKTSLISELSCDGFFFFFFAYWEKVLVVGFGSFLILLFQRESSLSSFWSMKIRKCERFSLFLLHFTKPKSTFCLLWISNMATMKKVFLLFLSFRYQIFSNNFILNWQVQKHTENLKRHKRNQHEPTTLSSLIFILSSCTQGCHFHVCFKVTDRVKQRWSLALCKGKIS